MKKKERMRISIQRKNEQPFLLAGLESSREIDIIAFAPMKDICSYPRTHVGIASLVTSPRIHFDDRRYASIEEPVEREVVINLSHRLIIKTSGSSLSKKL